MFACCPHSLPISIQFKHFDMFAHVDATQAHKYRVSAHISDDRCAALFELAAIFFFFSGCPAS